MPASIHVDTAKCRSPCVCEAVSAGAQDGKAGTYYNGSVAADLAPFRVRRIVRRPAAHAEHLDSVVDTGSAMAKGAASAGNPNVLVRPYASKIVMPITATIAGCQPRAQKPSPDHFKSEARGKGSKGPRH